MNLIRALANRLAGTPCRAHGNSIKVEVAGSILYPDAFVTCGPVPRGSTVLRDPVAIFEVLSRGTARTDRMVKNREYASTASVQRYVMLEQGAVGATMFERVGADWLGRILGADAVIRMPEVGIESPLAELYEGLDLSALPLDEDGEPAWGGHAPDWDCLALVDTLTLSSEVFPYAQASPAVFT